MSVRPCENCLNPNVPLRCSRCKSAYYCDEECQRGHWETHKPHCLPPALEKGLSAEDGDDFDGTAGTNFLFFRNGDNDYSIKLNVGPFQGPDMLKPYREVGIEDLATYHLPIDGITVYMDDNAYIRGGLGWNTAAMDVLTNVLDEDSKENNDLMKRLCQLNFNEPLLGGVALEFHNSKNGKLLKKRFEDHILNVTTKDNPCVKLVN